MTIILLQFPCAAEAPPEALCQFLLDFLYFPSFYIQIARDHYFCTCKSATKFNLSVGIQNGDFIRFHNYQFPSSYPSVQSFSSDQLNTSKASHMLRYKAWLYYPHGIECYLVGGCKDLVWEILVIGNTSKL